MKTALVTGAAGQDGSYLLRLLLDRGYRVVGTHRTGRAPDAQRLRWLGVPDDGRLGWLAWDASGLHAATALIEEVGPHEVYNLAGQSSAVAAARDPHATMLINGMAVVDLLEAIRRSGAPVRFLQAGSAELFGDAPAPQNEDTPIRPLHAYAVAKAAAHWATRDYARAHGLFACSALLFNHESPLRAPEFVTRKIARGMAAWPLGRGACIELGDLDARRDWGFAGDYADAMWRMLQAAEPQDLVIASGRAHTVREFATECAKAADLQIEWRGRGMDEHGVDRLSGRELVRVNPAFVRAREAHPRVGDPSRAERAIGWRAQTDLAGLCAMMVRAELDHGRAGRAA